MAGGRCQPYLVHVQWAQVQCVKSVRVRALALSPFLHLRWAQIVRGVDVSSLELTSLESLKGSALALHLLVLKVLQAAW